MEKILKLCEELARAAGAAILEIYATDFDVEYKAGQSPLTLADKRANDIIVRGLRAVCPDYGILSEESATELSQPLIIGVAFLYTKCKSMTL